MSLPANPAPGASDAKLVVLAREIAADLRPLEQILLSLGISWEDFEHLKASTRFQQLLEAAITEWNAAGNTYERTKIKAAMMVEDWLPEAHARLHDGTEALSAKTELAKLVTRLAGMGNDKPENADAGGKVNITINMGGEKLRFEHQVTPKVIDADASAAA